MCVVRVASAIWRRRLVSLVWRQLEPPPPPTRPPTRRPIWSGAGGRCNLAAACNFLRFNLVEGGARRVCKTGAARRVWPLVSSWRRRRRPQRARDEQRASDVACGNTRLCHVGESETLNRSARAAESLCAQSSSFAGRECPPAHLRCNRRPAIVLGVGAIIRLLLVRMLFLPFYRRSRPTLVVVAALRLVAFHFVRFARFVSFRSFRFGRRRRRNVGAKRAAPAG